MDPPPGSSGYKGQLGCNWGPLIFLLYHYYRAGGGPPKCGIGFKRKGQTHVYGVGLRPNSRRFKTRRSSQNDDNGACGRSSPRKSSRAGDVGCLVGFKLVNHMEDSQNQRYLSRVPNNTDDIILGSILGSPYFGILPYRTLAS